ncbi:VirB4 family type IV secretion system protein [Haloarcula nitratireducens]|uniref:Type IV secretory system conjugative DNA transfer family protein n=1 Tax=Haloarcula nitratireducens TaxID=2487749 RepID=A0AAW4PHD9_9EURY|nr:type IV secretory system conjugative DNA transfer family protein [Halomicroarcula nitratireducens]MBX0296860.1 type IV secretory system conjugative DNA transfer family protein [Halomicroarcula nitratireducens]
MSNSSSEFNTNIIHDDLGGTTEFWGQYTFGELVLFICPVFGYFALLGLPFVPASFLLPATGLLLATELVLFGLHRARPRYYRLTEWLEVRLRWALKKPEYLFGDGAQDTRTVTRLDRVLPHGVKRIDGAHCGAVQVTPANMALKDDGQWEKAVRSLTDLANSLEGKTNLYVTTREIDREAHVTAHQERLDDADTQRLPMLRGLLMEWLNRHTDGDSEPVDGTEMEREYYIIVSVTDADIDDIDRESASLLGSLESLPVVGRVAEMISSDGLTESERDTYKAKKLKDRVGTTARAVNSLYRCSGDPVSPLQLATLTKEYWACESQSFGNLDETTGLSPVHYSRSQEADALDLDIEDLEGGEVPNFDDDDVGEVPSAFSRPGKEQRSWIAPSAIDWEEDYTVIESETYARTFWVETFPEHPTSGMLERLLLDTELKADVSIHIDPYDAQDAVSAISEWVSSLRVLQEDVGELDTEDLQQDIERAKYIRQAVRRNHASLYRAGVFIRVTADGKEELREQTNHLETLMRDSPANCSIKRATRRQEQGLVTVSPLGGNELGHDRLSSMTGEALGALFPFSSNYLRMADGIRYGTHDHNDSTVLIDPWELETGHSELVTGMPGGGKTHGTQARGLRMMKKRSDVKQVFIDPVGDMRGSAELLDAKRITVSGETPLNPCEMHPTPQHVLDASPDMEPVLAKMDEVYGVIMNFLTSRDIALEMHSGLITFLIQTIFERSAIDPDDPSTHTPANSPTMQDLLDLIDEIQAEPGMFPGAETESAKTTIREYADELSVALQPFRRGSTYGNLAEESNLNLIDNDSKAVYLDLQQVEGSGDGLGKQSFIMQLLLSTLYQQAKNMETKVEVIIDEAHYLFADDANLAFLNQIARHQRHAGIRLVMLSQTLQEFYDGDAAEEIAGMCPIMVHHREPELDGETAKRAGMTSEQQHFVNNAEAGKESVGTDQGYSEALVRIDEHGDYPVQVRTSWEEKRVIDLDTHEKDPVDILIEEQPERIEAFEDFLSTEAMKGVLAHHGLTVDQAENVLSGLSEEELVKAMSVAFDQATADETEETQEQRSPTDDGTLPDSMTDTESQLHVQRQTDSPFTGTDGAPHENGGGSHE